MKRLSVLFGVLFLMVVLTACGQEGAKSGTVEVLEYDELIKKLDNEESFFLFTSDAGVGDLEKSNLVNMLGENLKEHDEGAYLVSLDGVDYSELESDYDKDEGEVYYSEYAHPKQESAGGYWIPSMDGLSYVENGKVVNTDTMHAKENDNRNRNTTWHNKKIQDQIEDVSSEFEFKIKEMVDIRIANLNELDIEVK